MRRRETDIWIDMSSDSKLYVMGPPDFCLRFSEPRSLNQLAKCYGIIFFNSFNPSCFFVSGCNYSSALPPAMKVLLTFLPQPYSGTDFQSVLCEVADRQVSLSLC